MPLTLTATPGSSTANSYATVAEADALASYRVGGAAFTALTSDQKIQALVTATRDIDSIEGATPGFVGGFIGERSSDTQALEWPRTGTDDYDDDELPAVLVEATIELAISYTPKFAAGATGDVLSADPNVGNIKEDTVGPITTVYFEPTRSEATGLARFPAIVQRLLNVLVEFADDSAWGSATVTRGS